MPNKVFICHSSKDHDFVIQLTEKLKQDSIDVWFDEWEIIAGDSITDKINKGLKSSSFFVIVFSSNLIKSGWAKKELNATLMRQITNRDVKILPILLDINFSDLPPLMRDISSIKFSGDIIDDNNYSKLVRPIKIKNEAELLKEFQDKFFDNIEHVDIILEKKEPTKHEVDFILNLIKDKAYENYFLKKVDSVEWFNQLKNGDFFAPAKAPIPTPTEQEGYFSVPQWNVLPYLERVSQQINVRGNEKYIDELLSIITNVSDYTDSNIKLRDNYQIWWYFVKILKNIPNKKISYKIIDLIPIWLESKFGINIVDQEIATELLPKFLPENPLTDDIKKAEKIVDYITNIKWIPIREDLLAKEEARMLIDSHWLIESFVNQKYSIRIAERCGIELVISFANKLKGIFRRRNNPHALDFEVSAKKYRIFVDHSKDFEFDCIVGILDKEQLENRSMEEILYGIPLQKPKPLHKFELDNCRDKENFVTRIIVELSKVGINAKALSDSKERLQNFYIGIFSDNSYIWFESIAGESGWTALAAEQVLTIILRDILLAKAKKDSKNARDTLETFLSENYQYPYFKRLVLYIISECWDDFKDKFWSMLKKPGGVLLFDNPNFEVEIYTLLEKNINHFTPTEKDMLKKIIEKGPKSYVPQKNKMRYKHYWKQKWYSAMKTDTYFSPLYEKHKKSTKIEEKISFKESKTKSGPGSSPLSKEEILNMSNTNLAEFLKTFRTKDLWDGPTINGLAETLKALAQEKPEKFIDDLKPFLNMGYYYIYQILQGIREAWNKKIDIDWGKLLNFIKQYVDTHGFWQNMFKMDDDQWNADYKWSIWVIGDLIQEGTKNDKWVFSKEHLPVAQEILFVILDKLQPEREKETLDPITHAMNSAFGTTITAMIYLALRIARLQRKDDEEVVKWSDDLREKYETMLKQNIVEAYALFGQFIGNLYYLDKSWVEKKIQKFLGINYKLWYSYMYGYLVAGRFHKNMYVLMREHYKKAISDAFKEKSIEKMLVQHIAVGYLQGIDDKSGVSLFDSMLAKWYPSQIMATINFFWMQRNVLIKKAEADIAERHGGQRNKIIKFWGVLYEKYMGKSLNDDDKKILSAVIKLTIFLDKINNLYIDWLMLSVPYVHLEFNSPIFIEYLDKLKDKDNKVESAKYVGKIFLKMLKTYTPDYNPKHIRSIIGYLFSLEDTSKMANDICNIYGKEGYDFITKDIWKKYKGSKNVQ